MFPIVEWFNAKEISIIVVQLRAKLAMTTVDFVITLNTKQIMKIMYILVALLIIPRMYYLEDKRKCIRIYNIMSRHLVQV